MRAPLLLALAACAAMRSAALAQSSASAPAAPAAASEPARPRLAALRVEQPPVLDGRLDDACWQLAPATSTFTQVEPVEGAAPAKRTELRVVYDRDTLYVGVRCFDDEPDKLLARQMERDAALDPDDRVEILFDTFGDQRNAFWFQMNPVGDLGDALVSNNGADFNKPWDGLWDGRASIDAQGYSLEFALPFKTLNFAPGLTRWGFNARRLIKRLDQEARWASPRRELSFFSIADAGELVGLREMRQGVGLDVTPYFVGRWRQHGESDGDSDLLGKPGLDAAYKLTPGFNALLTLHTDFADTEVDDRQINLTRFPLFFPEKRDFFLQDAGLFRFADLGNGSSGGSDLIPFFSRRIGLDAQGGEVPIEAGLKLSGRQDGWNLGVLDVQTEATDSLDSRNLFAARVSRNIGAQSTLGLIATAGEPTEEADNALVGFDYNYRSSRFLGDQSLRASAWALATQTEDLPGDDHAYGASLALPGDEWSYALAFKEIQQNFHPGLGFAPRTGIRRINGSASWSPWVQGAIRRLEFSLAPSLVYDIDGELETGELAVQPLGIEFDSGDFLSLELVSTRDVLDEAFEIHEGVTIAAQGYDFTRVRAALESSERRALIASLSYEAGDFYDGTRQDWGAELVWRPGRFFNGALAFEQSDLHFDADDFSTRLVQARANLTFSPRASWSNFVQWDNESDSLGLNSRLRWSWAPGRELRLVLNNTWTEDEKHALAPGLGELALKLEYALRY